MKISVLLPSRGRPHHLRRTISRLDSMSSGRHEIVYVIGCDDDDPETLEAAYVSGFGEAMVSVWCTRRLGSLGEMVNRMAAQHPADVYCSLCDDVEVMTPGWDDAIAFSWTKKPDGLWWWQTPKERYATYAIVSDRWYKAAGYIFTDLFPFWWDDVWLLQVWSFATNQQGVGINAFLDDRGFATHRMRDLRFWAEFYEYCGLARRAEAARIAKALGWPARTPSAPGHDLKAGYIENEVPGIEAKQGDRRPPTPEYLRAKARAEALMKSGRQWLPPSLDLVNQGN